MVDRLHKGIKPNTRPSASPAMTSQNDDVLDRLSNMNSNDGTPAVILSPEIEETAKGKAKTTRS